MAVRPQWSRQWRWEVDLSPAALWPILADTARFGEAGGVPRYEVVASPRPDGSVERIARARLGGLTAIWEVRPYEWVVERYHRQVMRFRAGPLALLIPCLELEPRSGGGTRVTYTFTAEPASFLGRCLLQAGLLGQLGRAAEKRVSEAVEYLHGRRREMFAVPPPKLNPGGPELIAAAIVQLEYEGFGEISSSLAQLVGSGADVDVEEIRPRRLARSWQVPERRAIDLCLAAVKAGLLSLRWGLLCPRCRGASLTVPALDQLPRGSHCPSCNIAFDRNFTRNVELTFRPSAAIRAVTDGAFCHAGPMLTAHVLVQQILQPGESRAIVATLPGGTYRLRTLEPGGEVEVAVDHQFPRITLQGGTVELGSPDPPGTLLAANLEATERTLVVETPTWSHDALTAHEATTLQGFRDLFATDTLRFGDDVAIDRVAILFTDLKASTELYGRLGDGAAFRIVREHYAFLTALIRRRDGAVVKTIGDSVMAVFARPHNALAAALDIQSELAAFNAAQLEESPDGPVLILKAGLHCGACIAVTLNTRIDYFGATVNLAARLEHASQGSEVVLSQEVADDPDVAALLTRYRTQSDHVALKGIEHPVAIVRARVPESEAPRLGGAGMI